MTLDDVYLETAESMENAVKALDRKLRSIRTGRASPSLVENLRVDYYGTSTPIIQLANITVPEARLLVLKPFDPSSLEAISKAIIASDIGINPQSDGKVIRLQIPAMTEETRRKQTAIVKDEGERTRVAVRAARRDAVKAVDDLKKSGGAPEDDCFKMKDEIQKLTEETDGKIATLVDKKSKEIMEL